MSPKEELLNRAAQEYKAFYQSLDGLNEAQLTEVWLEAWSIQDIVAHMVGWHIGWMVSYFARYSMCNPAFLTPTTIAMPKCTAIISLLNWKALLRLHDYILVNRSSM